MEPEMLELYQAEWCPYSRRVRQRMTELGLDFFARQAPVRREERTRVISLSGQAGIPVLVDDGTVISGSEAILAHLNARYADTPASTEHRLRAAEKRQEELESACSERSKASATELMQ